ncbi:alanyl-tRNA synthetase [Acetitomaculum ruminis DSM 5522]|uniref:Alanine--tRNA ligase n=1 Tax=Acetitomaculum ruminis DSM 5522 TaxID=1120918 RepID=A0A1I0UYT0_9FIRM|nr:alanine--tRNA ligase [Acetitomaculum ruminis]SFA69205.1 alanyl-tRNA synthetase [Acetitomaculum ruminis DSM 5522]
MKPYGVNELRKMFLDFMESKGHLVMNSFSLVPHNDNSLLLINAGMAPLKPYFTGQEIPPRTRVATCQKCIRTGDIENVGKTARHGTFFEMLGNFSFGDYFKEEAIEWSWEFLTKVIGLEEDRLYPSIYQDDDEAFDIWNKKVGIAADRIYRFGKEDNFWEHGAGPCGPCSEIYYDRGEEYGCGEDSCEVGCDCDRYMEIWNNVFTQFENDGKGNYELLKQKNIDTGMGLERLAVVVQNVSSIFDVDTIKDLRDRVCEIANVTYQTDEKKDISIRLITDHIRSATFMISDGITPSNEGRGYVLRRLIRRAARHGRLLGIKGTFLNNLCKTVIAGSKDGYPELEEKSVFIEKVLIQEEEQFNKTLDQGLNILNGYKEELVKNNEKELKGADVFKLYDTYGFPLDLTKEILEEDNISVDEEGFKECMEKQRQTARAARKTSNYMGADATVYEELPKEMSSEFTGYEKTTDTSKIIALVEISQDDSKKDEIVQALTDGQKGSIITEKTPFYATSGGQEADTGIIKSANGEFVVEDTIKAVGQKIVHIGYMKSGMLKTDDEVTLTIDLDKRLAAGKNHSATHLLQRALRDVLGEHVHQEGSNVNKDRLRFDFSHFAPMTKEELEKVEKIVNEKISEGLDVVTDIMNLEDARKTGAMALFGEKYGDKVRVVKMGDFSTELCGGTHVKNTSTIGNFKIISESGIAAGTRRIEAITANGVLEYFANIEKLLEKASGLLKATPDNLLNKLEGLIEQNKELHAENESLKSKAAKDALGDVMDNVVTINGVKLLAASVDDVDMNELRQLGDSLKEKLKEGVIVLASAKDGKVNLVAMATEEAMKKGAHAGMLIKAIATCVGGGGGGRPQMAQAGGKNPAGIKDAIVKASEVLKEQIG